MSSRSSRSNDSRDHRSTSPHSRKYRSPSPEQLRYVTSDTSDPKLKKCRVFVSNVGSENCKILDLKLRFEKYGEIRGISIHRGFAFVQFGKESSAEQAIKEENRTMFKGRKIDVKTAAVSSESFGRSRDSARSISPGARHSRERSRYQIFISCVCLVNLGR
ncbi:HNRNPC (predicted) [Pycnogonum litorale]